MSTFKEYCLFILGIYGETIFNYFYTLMQKQEVQQFVFYSTYAFGSASKKIIDKMKETVVLERQFLF